jgi:hypothetical protein
MLPIQDDHLTIHEPALNARATFQAESINFVRHMTPQVTSLDEIARPANANKPARRSSFFSRAKARSDSCLLSFHPSAARQMQAPLIMDF